MISSAAVDSASSSRQQLAPEGGHVRGVRSMTPHGTRRCQRQPILAQISIKLVPLEFTSQRTTSAVGKPPSTTVDSSDRLRLVPRPQVSAEAFPWVRHGRREREP